LEERGLVNGSFTFGEGSAVHKDYLDKEEEDDSWLIPTQAVEVDCRNIKWTEKMLRSFEQAKNGQYKAVDISNFWNV
jgi:hypothetical protein